MLSLLLNIKQKREPHKEVIPFYIFFLISYIAYSLWKLQRKRVSCWFISGTTARNACYCWLQFYFTSMVYACIDLCCDRCCQEWYNYKQSYLMALEGFNLYPQRCLRDLPKSYGFCICRCDRRVAENLPHTVPRSKCWDPVLKGLSSHRGLWWEPPLPIRRNYISDENHSKSPTFYQGIYQMQAEICRQFGCRKDIQLKSSWAVSTVCKVSSKDSNKMKAVARFALVISRIGCNLSQGSREE